MPYHKVVGIYTIVNTANDKCYVGSSASVLNRWASHRSRLRKGKHGNPHLQHAWDYYGEDAFDFILLEEMRQDELIEAEQEWLDRLGEQVEMYNVGLVVHPTRQGIKSGPMPGWHRRKIQAAMMGWKELPYPAFRHIETGEIIPAGVGLAALCRKRKLSYKNMWQVIQGQCRSYRGWVLDISDWEEHEIGRSHGSKLYPAYCNVETGEYIPPGRNLARTCRKWGLNPAHMRSIANRTRYNHKGWELCDDT